MGNAEKRAIGVRLERIRSALGIDREAMAAKLGVKLRAYTNYVAGETSPDADQLGFTVAEGWNANWVIAGAEPERLEAFRAAETRAGYGSQVLSAGHLTIALEMADEKLARDQVWLPRPDYAELVVLILERLQQGWAYPRIRALVDAVLSRVAKGEGVHAGRSGGVDGEGPGGPV